MTKKLSDDLQLLEDMFDKLNEDFFESALSKPIITIQGTPKFYGHFWAKKWEADKDSACHEINLGAETINRSLLEVTATLVHEMVHLYCFDNNIQDTSQNGRYHNKKFKEEAEKRGLIIEKMGSRGWTKTTPAKELIEWFENSPFADREISKRRQAKTTRTKSSTRKYSCPSCPVSIRATKEVVLICKPCNELLVRA